MNGTSCLLFCRPGSLKIANGNNADRGLIISITMSANHGFWTAFFNMTVFVNDIMIANTSPAILQMPLMNF